MNLSQFCEQNLDGHTQKLLNNIYIIGFIYPYTVYLEKKIIFLSIKMDDRNTNQLRHF